MSRGVRESEWWRREATYVSRGSQWLVAAQSKRLLGAQGKMRGRPSESAPGGGKVRVLSRADAGLGRWRPIFSVLDPCSITLGMLDALETHILASGTLGVPRCSTRLLYCSSVRILSASATPDHPQDGQLCTVLRLVPLLRDAPARGKL